MDEFPNKTSEVIQYVSNLKAIVVEDPFIQQHILNPEQYETHSGRFKPFGDLDSTLVLERIRMLGYNSIKLSLCLEGLAPERPDHLSEPYLNDVFSLLKICARYRIGVVVELAQRHFSRRLGGSGFPDWMLTEGILDNITRGDMVQTKDSDRLAYYTKLRDEIIKALAEEASGPESFDRKDATIDPLQPRGNPESKLSPSGTSTSVPSHLPGDSGISPDMTQHQGASLGPDQWDDAERYRMRVTLAQVEEKIRSINPDSKSSMGFKSYLPSLSLDALPKGASSLLFEAWNSLLSQEAIQSRYIVAYSNLVRRIAETQPDAIAGFIPLSRPMLPEVVQARPITLPFVAGKRSNELNMFTSRIIGAIHESFERGLLSWDSTTREFLSPDQPDLIYTLGTPTLNLPTGKEKSHRVSFSSHIHGDKSKGKINVVPVSLFSPSKTLSPLFFVQPFSDNAMAISVPTSFLGLEPMLMSRVVFAPVISMSRMSINCPTLARQLTRANRLGASCVWVADIERVPDAQDATMCKLQKSFKNLVGAGVGWCFGTSSPYIFAQRDIGKAILAPDLRVAKVFFQASVLGLQRQRLSGYIIWEASDRTVLTPYMKIRKEADAAAVAAEAGIGAPNDADSPILFKQSHEKEGEEIDSPKEPDEPRKTQDRDSKSVTGPFIAVGLQNLTDSDLRKNAQDAALLLDGSLLVQTHGDRAISEYAGALMSVTSLDGDHLKFQAYIFRMAGVHPDNIGIFSPVRGSWTGRGVIAAFYSSLDDLSKAASRCRFCLCVPLSFTPGGRIRVSYNVGEGYWRVQGTGSSLPSPTLPHVPSVRCDYIKATCMTP